MVRLYGSAPYEAVLVHGGPGAIGELHGFAHKLSAMAQCGIVEALQSKYSVNGLIEELRGQIEENCCGRATLVGHSWGAWLAALLAAKYPFLVRRVVLIGCAPLKDEYVSEISERRLKRLDKEDAAAFQRLLDCMATDSDLARMPAVLERADNYCLEDAFGARETDGEMYRRVWDEASAMRSSGELLALLSGIKCEICVIHGRFDPHPVRGVILPFSEVGVSVKAYVLDKCGHSPFLEKYSKDEFYRILVGMIK